MSDSRHGQLLTGTTADATSTIRGAEGILVGNNALKPEEQNIQSHSQGRKRHKHGNKPNRFFSMNLVNKSFQLPRGL